MNLSPSEFLTYGWQTDDCISPSQCCSSDYCVDLKENTKFHIEFFMDCDKSMISNFNEKTKRSREINVNGGKCPLPWKIYFYFYDVGDSVRLLCSCQISSN
jgi:hypothetical protein